MQQTNLIIFLQPSFILMMIDGKTVNIFKVLFQTWISVYGNNIIIPEPIGDLTRKQSESSLSYRKISSESHTLTISLLARAARSGVLTPCHRYSSSPASSMYTPSSDRSCEITIDTNCYSSSYLLYVALINITIYLLFILLIQIFEHDLACPFDSDSCQGLRRDDAPIDCESPRRRVLLFFHGST